MLNPVSCPYCQKPLNVTEHPGMQPLVCPHCLSNISNPLTMPASQAPNVLRDIRQKVRGPGWLFWLIIAAGVVMCVVRIVTYKIDPNAPQNRIHPIDLYPPFLGLDVFVVLAIVAPLWRYLKVNHFSASFDAVSQIVLLIFLTGALAIAIGVFFCVVCGAVG